MWVGESHGKDSLRDESPQKQKGRTRDLRMRPLNLILAVTYVPASFPAQYHRPCKA
jgi:hypothetical protein